MVTVAIREKEDWVKWFEVRGFPELRRDYEAELAARVQVVKEAEPWYLGMSKAIRPVWAEDIFINSMGIDIKPMRDALLQDMPIERDRILALLEWFGSGFGSWSRFPRYQKIPERLLLDYSTQSIVGAIESGLLSPQQTEGAARLFAGALFARKRPDDLRELPENVKQLLWDHTKCSKDAEKHEIARKTFAC